MTDDGGYGCVFVGDRRRLRRDLIATSTKGAASRRIRVLYRLPGSRIFCATPRVRPPVFLEESEVAEDQPRRGGGSEAPASANPAKEATPGTEEEELSR
jgi:hypothetical protein